MNPSEPTSGADTGTGTSSGTGAGSRRRGPGDPNRFSGLVPVQFTGTGPALDPIEFAVIDVETTGLRPRHDRIIEIAVVRCDPSGSPISEWSTLIDPGRDPGPTRVHGIAATDLAGAPTFAHAIDELRQQLAGAVVVAHNLSFDSAFLAHEFRRAGLDPHDGFGLCTLELARTSLPDLEGHSLAACARALSIPQPLAHRALADTRVTAGLLQAIIAGLDPTPGQLTPPLRLAAPPG